MARLNLREIRRDESLSYLHATLAPQAMPTAIRYKTRLGALLRVDGVAAGAYDREHHEVVLPACERERDLSFEVELHALPTNGLPSGPGPIWWYLNATAAQEPAKQCHSQVLKDLKVSKDPATPPADPLPVFGHSHLDVAWLWTYEQAQRKAQRTFATACDLLDRDPAFRFVQSQPQLYAFVEESDAQLFERVQAHAAGGRFDPRVAALWVESDCNIPSGESLLRQMLHAHTYCTQRFGVVPSIAWLPDTFGFMNTIPQLLAHAGIPYFGTTKLQWNDTTKFPYPQFVWRGPDGSEVIGALLQGYDGPAYPWRVAAARQRGEPLALGYGDGGGGVTAGMLDHVARMGTWIDLHAWFAQVRDRRSSLPVHADELYLEYHRGVYTTHHLVKFHNALCERALGEAEELLAWCLAVHAPAATVAQLMQRLDAAWQIVLRNQFHDVLPGTSIAQVYDDAAGEYAAAEEFAASVIGAAQTILPRATTTAEAAAVAPIDDSDCAVFENRFMRARLRFNGTIVELNVAGGRNVCAQGNVLALYRDKPKQWEAWNIDRGYDRRLTAAKPLEGRIEDEGLTVDLRLGKSPATMRVQLFENEAFLRVTLAVDWKERRRLLRLENWFAVQTERVLYGAPHGTLERSARSETPAEKAKFEVPGQRFAAVRDADGHGVALFALDTYGWSARRIARGGIKLGHSLLRGTCWPDPHADEGEHFFSYAYAPFAGASTGALEHAWLAFAHEPRVRMFSTDDEAIVVAACKPAQNGQGVLVRVRECNGAPANVRLRCGARMTAAHGVDALERPRSEPVQVEGEYLLFSLRPYELRSLLVRFSHET